MSGNVRDGEGEPKEPFELRLFAWLNEKIGNSEWLAAHFLLIAAVLGVIFGVGLFLLNWGSFGDLHFAAKAGLVTGIAVFSVSLIAVPIILSKPKSGDSDD
jgi:hypothetical protein